MSKFKMAKCHLTNKKYKVEELDKLEPDNPILSDLHCVNCDCALVFHHSGKRSAYLATKIGCNHSEDCINQVRREVAKERKEYKYSGSEPLTRTQQTRLAKSGYKSWMEKSAGIQPKNKHHSLSTKVTKNTHRTKKDSFFPVAANNGTVPVGEKKTKLSTRTPLVAVVNIGKYIGQAIKVVGRVISVHVQKHKAYISLIRDNMKLNVYLNEATFRNSAVGLQAALKELNTKISNQKFVARVCAIVDVISSSSDGSPMCMLRTEDGLIVNGLTLRIALFGN